MGEDQQALLLYAIGALFIGISLLMSSMIALRAFFSIASIFFILYGILQGDNAIAIASSIFLLINVYFIAAYLISIRKVKLPKKLSEIHQIFQTYITPSEFKHLLDRAKRKIYYNETILEQGKDVEELMMIISGTVEVVCDGAKVNTLGPGNFIGEFGILTNSQASASVKSRGLVEVSVWEKSAINHEKKLRELVSINLVAKIVSSNKQKAHKEEAAVEETSPIPAN